MSTVASEMNAASSSSSISDQTDLSGQTESSQARSGLAKSSSTDEQSATEKKKEALQPLIQFGPASWNVLYFSILGFSFLIGFGALLNGRTPYTALLAFVGSLMAMFVLGVSFVSFVVMPLTVKHFERLKEETRRETEEALRAKMRKAEENSISLREERLSFMAGPKVDVNSAFQNANGVSGAEFGGSAPEKKEHSNGTGAPAPEKGSSDQAASLRKMMANIEQE